MQTFNLNFGAFFRYNFNTRVAMRAQILSGAFLLLEMWKILDLNLQKTRRIYR